MGRKELGCRHAAAPLLPSTAARLAALALSEADADGRFEVVDDFLGRGMTRRLTLVLAAAAALSFAACSSCSF